MAESIDALIALVVHLFDVFMHLDRYLVEWTQAMGAWIYAVLFLIVFCETGLVVTPFLPGDSLLFAAGALTAIPGVPVDLAWLVLLLIIAAIVGDAVNYSIGIRVGPKVFARSDTRWLNPKHLHRAQTFYEKYGGKTIIFARFVPIVRTFAPFVAGIGRMRYRRFFAFNAFGAVVWVAGFAFAGRWFGNIPAVKRNFQYVILAIIVLSVLPAVVEILRERRRTKNEPHAAQP